MIGITTDTLVTPCQVRIEYYDSVPTAEELRTRIESIFLDLWKRELYQEDLSVKLVYGEEEKCFEIHDTADREEMLNQLKRILET